MQAIQVQSERINKGWQEITSNGTLLGFHDSSEHNLPGNKEYGDWQYRALPILEAIPSLIDYLVNEGYAIKKLSDMDLVEEKYVDKRTRAKKEHAN